MTPEVFLVKAMRHVESKSIRQWVTDEKNYPRFVELAGKAMDRKLDDEYLAGYIMCLALEGPAV